MENNYENYERDGFHLVKGLFEKKKAQEAAHWLRSQDLEKLSTSIMDRSPMDSLARYQRVHHGNSPIAQLANHPETLQIASQLAGEEVYIWGSQVNLKSAWYGRVDYYHQDFAYYEPRGYENPIKHINCYTFLDQHNVNNAGLHLFPGSHKEGLLKHGSVFDVNGMHKLVISPKDLNKFYIKYGIKVIDAEPGDVLFFNSLVIHGSGHNASPNHRMVILTQVNSKKHLPQDVSSKVKAFNLSRTQQEIESAKEKYEFYKEKYEKQLKTNKIIFNNPVPKEEL